MTTARTVASFTRAEFIAERWDYHRGDHVTVLAPTDWGKTYLVSELLAVTASPKLQAVNLAIKPRDKTMKDWTAKLGYKTVKSWPPPPQLLRKPNGYTLWPRHTFDPDVDDWTLHQQFRKAIRDCYRRGNKILNVDEILGMIDLGLMKDLRAVWTRGRSMGCGLWGTNQSPTFIGRWAYSQAAHLFLGNDPDRRARERFAEIGGGIDPDTIRRVTLELQEREWLYLRRRGRVMCKITMD